MSDGKERISKILERFRYDFEANSQFKLQLSYSCLSFENSNDFQKWDYFLKEISYLPVGWNETSIEYQKAYMFSDRADIEIFKFSISNLEKVIAIFTTTIEIYEIASIVNFKLRNISPPLVEDTLQIREKDLVYQSWLAAVKKLSCEIELNRTFLEITRDKEIFFNSIKLIGLESNFQFVGQKEYYFIDLFDSEKNIYRNIRKSYKSLINQQMKKYHYKILCSENYKQKSWEDFRLLHLSVAGIITRNEESWNLQGKMIKEGNAFLVSAFLGDKIIGGTFITLSKNEAYYGVGAYVRGAKELICSHSLQYLAVKEAKRIGITNYILGDACLENDYFKYSTKEKNIALFKKGFTISSITTEAFLIH